MITRVVKEIYPDFSAQNDGSGNRECYHLCGTVKRCNRRSQYLRKISAKKAIRIYYKVGRSMSNICSFFTSKTLGHPDLTNKHIKTALHCARIQTIYFHLKIVLKSQDLKSSGGDNLKHWKGETINYLVQMLLNFSKLNVFPLKKH